MSGWVHRDGVLTFSFLWLCQNGKFWHTAVWGLSPLSAIKPNHCPFANNIPLSPPPFSHPPSLASKLKLKTRTLALPPGYPLPILSRTVPLSRSGIPHLVPTKHYCIKNPICFFVILVIIHYLCIGNRPFACCRWLLIVSAEA